MNSAFQTTDANFKRDVLDSRIPVLVDFWAEWCPPCRMMERILEELAGEYQGRLKIQSVNVEENFETTQRYQVRSMPTFLFFKDGQVVKQRVGANSKTKFTEEIESLL